VKQYNKKLLHFVYAQLGLQILGKPKYAQKNVYRAQIFVHFYHYIFIVFCYFYKRYLNRAFSKNTRIY